MPATVTVPAYGYNITGIDVLEAYAAVMLVTGAIGVDKAVAKENVRATITTSGVGGMLVQRVLVPKLMM
ncbi:hypothetical protein D3C72_1490790 [compost metagenome]